jgi:rod shape-determining protein MreD
VKLPLALGLGLLAMAVSGVLLRVFGFSNARIEIAAVLVVYACTALDTTRAAICSFAAGYLFDLMSGAPTGLYAFVAMLTFIVCRVAVVMVDVSGPVSFGLLCAFIDGIHQLLAYGLLTFFAGRSAPHPSSAALFALPATCVLTGIAAAVLHPLFNRLDLAFDRPDTSGLVR